MYVERSGLLCVNLQEHFWSLDESVEKLTPRLMVQIWDNDLGFANDDFLGECLHALSSSQSVDF